MSHANSIYAAELTLRGFDLWQEETVESSLNERFEPRLAPAFLCVTTVTLTITFAYDENLVLWATEGVVDLSDLGFTELEFDDDGPSRVLN